MFVRGCEKFVIALAYMFCLALVGSCLARFAYFLADLCSYQYFMVFRTGSSDAKGNKHIEHPGDVAGGAGGGGAGTGKTLDRIVNAKEEVSDTNSRHVLQ